MTNVSTLRPLDGIKVIDLTHYVAGPYCTRLLSDYGASVLKIERPGGDPSRHWAPFATDEDGGKESLFYLYLNHGKESVTLDLKSVEGRDRVLEFVKDADVLVENFRPGTIDSFGLGWETLHAANPKLILTSISNFGQTGPYRDYRAWDIVATAVGGLAYIHGQNNREPLVHGNPQAQYRGGVAAASATVAALINRDDEGEHVDVSITECIAAALRDTIPQYTFMGAVRQRGSRAVGGQGRITPCEDGYVITTGIGATEFSDFARFMGAPELADEKFATGEGRQQNSAELTSLLRKRLQTWKMMDYFEGAQMWGMGAGIVMSPAQALQCKQHLERGFFNRLETESGRHLTAPRGPFVL